MVLDIQCLGACSVQKMAAATKAFGLNFLDDTSAKRVHDSSDMTGKTEWKQL